MASQNNMENGSFKLSMEDDEYLSGARQRGLRLMTEYDKPEQLLQQAGIASTIVAFGSARVMSPEQAQEFAAAAQTREQKALAALRLGQTRWYEMAREFGKIASLEGGAIDGKDGLGLHRNVIATGGGPGLMEAANRGAYEAGAPSIGFTIQLPNEERPNPYTTPGLTFRFKYFGVRKIHLVLRARALAVFPGGYGTLDELFEVANLNACSKIDPMPIVLFDRDFWNRTMNMKALLDEGLISKEAYGSLWFADSAREGWDMMKSAGLGAAGA